MTDGMKSSEFWSHVLVTLGAVIAASAGVLDPKWAALVAALSQAAYAASRGLSKQGSGGAAPGA